MSRRSSPSWLSSIPNAQSWTTSPPHSTRWSGGATSIAARMPPGRRPCRSTATGTRCTSVTDAGFRAYQAVEQVLGARLDDAALSRLVFPDILSDLDALAAASRIGDAEEVYRKLSRLDRALSDMAERAARFYLLLGELARTTDHRADVFLAHKDALLTHLREFHTELLRYSPRLHAATQAVAATGVERLLELAAEADDRLFRTPGERLADWRQRWVGMVAWFGADQPPTESDRLQQATVAAISDVLAMLRRVTEARRGGVGRESQLRHFAAWFTNTPSEAAAHALYGAVFALREPRHVGIAHDDPEEIPTRRSWWEVPAVEVSRTLLETGRSPGPGRPAAIERNAPARHRLREKQLAEVGERRAAAEELAAGGAHGRVLSEAETVVLLALLDRALSARVPVRAAVRASGSAHGVRLVLAPCGAVTTGGHRPRLAAPGRGAAVGRVVARSGRSAGEEARTCTDGTNGRRRAAN